MAELLNKEISSLFTRLILLIGLTFTLSMILFGGSFSFWNSAFSDLGSTITPDGISNYSSCIIFMIGMVISGIIFFMIGWLFLKNKNIVHHRLKFTFSLMGSLGCFIFIFPHNINNNIHMIGAALFVAAVWALGTLFLIESRKIGERERTVILQTILQSTVISYAISYFADLSIKNIAQKFAVFGLIIVLKSVTSFRTIFEWRKIAVFNSKYK
ncbi:MAG: hypothetical protein JXR87_03995 [Candidatus Marinimicrobia bacterium]|nr:hypothetical protein [Candidatus Neomarinimicrobiota bacterium]